MRPCCARGSRRTSAATHPSELDYAITRGAPGGFTATVPRGGGPDHVPVEFTRDPPPVRAPLPSHVFHSVLAAPTGGLLQENPNRTITIGQARYNGSQTFQMFTTDALTHYLQNTGTGDCIAIAPSARRAVSAPIVAGRCDDPRAQWTIAHLDDPSAWNDDNGGPQRWRNVAVPGLCLTPNGAYGERRALHPGHRPAVVGQRRLPARRLADHRRQRPPGIVLPRRPAAPGRQRPGNLRPHRTHTAPLVVDLLAVLREAGLRLEHPGGSAGTTTWSASRAFSGNKPMPGQPGRERQHADSCTAVWV
ncbi:hypothetical protein SRIMM317S_03075 [Streptomyces rimosus subsp. rimosus]